MSVLDLVGLVSTCLLGLIWALFWGWPFCGWIGTRVGDIVSPREEFQRIPPQFSIPESKVKQGKYDEAILLFRELSQNYPGEITPHLRIADIMLEKKGDRDAAIRDFEVAVTKARTVDALALVSFRLVDLYIQENPKSEKALKLLREVQRQYPNTKQAKISEERAKVLLAQKFEET